MNEEQRMEKALKDVSALMRELRPDRKNEKPATYTQETQAAFKGLFALCLDGISILADRVKALEAREDAFKGVHQRSLSYRKGDFVTHNGNLWCALKAVPPGMPPGPEPAYWQLAAKGPR